MATVETSERGDHPQSGHRMRGPVADSYMPKPGKRVRIAGKDGREASVVWLGSDRRASSGVDQSGPAAARLACIPTLVSRQVGRDGNRTGSAERTDEAQHDFNVA